MPVILRLSCLWVLLYLSSRVPHVVQAQTPSPPPPYAYTGACQNLTIPTNVNSIIINADGAQGGGSTGGLGGNVVATVPVTPGSVLGVYVGASGANGGWPGGGAKSTFKVTDTQAGGGYSAVCSNACGSPRCTPLVIAGAGGAGFGKDCHNYLNPFKTCEAKGGAGGGSTGQNGQCGGESTGYGGSQIAGGARDKIFKCAVKGSSGEFEQGGKACFDGEGGGGGYFGGGGGFCAGGGGSSFVISAGTVTINYQGVRQGDGQVTIQYVSPPTTGPTPLPTLAPTAVPSSLSTQLPTVTSTSLPTKAIPVPSPISLPIASPTAPPTSYSTTLAPTLLQTPAPTLVSTLFPTRLPTASPPSSLPTEGPTVTRKDFQTTLPTPVPRARPTLSPSKATVTSTTSRPSVQPTAIPTTQLPTSPPTFYPFSSPTGQPSAAPTRLRLLQASASQAPSSASIVGKNTPQTQSINSLSAVVASKSASVFLWAGVAAFACCCVGIVFYYRGGVLRRREKTPYQIWIEYKDRIKNEPATRRPQHGPEFEMSSDYIPSTTADNNTTNPRQRPVGSISQYQVTDFYQRSRQLTCSGSSVGGRGGLGGVAEEAEGQEDGADGGEAGENAGQRTTELSASSRSPFGPGLSAGRGKSASVFGSVNPLTMPADRTRLDPSSSSSNSNFSEGQTSVALYGGNVTNPLTRIASARVPPPQSATTTHFL